MKTIWISYIHASGNETTQPIVVDPEMEDRQIADFKKYLLESGEALEILDNNAPNPKYS